MTEQKRTILFTEDDRQGSEWGKKVLEERFPSHEVLTAYSMKESLEKIEGDYQRLDLVITDGELDESYSRGEWGWHLAKELRTNGYTGNIYFWSTKGIPQDYEQFITKRIDQGDVLRLSEEDLLSSR
jgi:hypothetical protein